MKDFYKLESKPDLSFQTYFGLSFYKNYNILINFSWFPSGIKAVLLF